MAQENNNAEQSYLDLPDDEILNMMPPEPKQPEAPAPEDTPSNEEEVQAPVEQETQEQETQEQPGKEEGGEAQTPPATTTGDGADEDPKETPDPLSQPDDDEREKGKDAGTPQADPADPAPDPAKAEDGKQDNTDTTPTSDDEKKVEVAEPSAEDHKAFFDRILKNPIRANGKDFQVRSPEEAERLIQMGLNYTKKMQAWQPRMRVVTMLENNGLMDEAKLAHLIDLSKGDPGAIQKLLADSKFDPMEVDADKAASYKPGNHQVSDVEMAFNTVLDDLEASDTGVELINEMAKQWDEQSRRAVYQDPGILRVINEQKGSGLFARIKTEMDHLKTLGHLQGVPFLQAYRAVGDMLNEQGRLVAPETQKQQQAPVQPAPSAPAPVATRVAAPAPKVANSDRAAAASPTKATPTAPKQEKTYLDVPDDQFLKEMEGRV